MKKILSLVLVLVLALTAIGGTLAYFTDTDNEKNVFIVGDVDIELDEPKYEGNNQHLVPGSTIVKDPTVTVAADSEDCWLMVEIEWNRYKAFISTAINAEVIQSVNDLATKDGREAFVDYFVTGLDHSKWTVLNTDALEQIAVNQDALYLPIILGYKDILKANDKVVVFNGIKFDKNLTQEQMKLFYQYADGTEKTGPNEVIIDITATAVQAENVATIEDAYAIAYPPAP